MKGWEQDGLVGARLDRSRSWLRGCGRAASRLRSRGSEEGNLPSTGSEPGCLE